MKFFMAGVPLNTSVYLTQLQGQSLDSCLLPLQTGDSFLKHLPHAYTLRSAHVPCRVPSINLMAGVGLLAFSIAWLGVVFAERPDGPQHVGAERKSR